MRSVYNTDIFSFTKIYTKSIIFIFSTLLVMTGCDTDDANFLSRGGEGREDDAGRKSRDINVRIVVDALKQTGNRTGQPSPFSGGGPSSDGDFSPGDPSAGEDTVYPPTGHSRGDPSREQAQEKSPLKKIDILFYLAHKDDGSCWNSFARSIKKSGFFSYIEDFSWQTATAFYSHNPVIYRFRKAHSLYLGLGGNNWGVGAKPVYVLKKGLFSVNESDQYLAATITTEYSRNVYEHYEPAKRTKWPGEPQFPWPFGGTGRRNIASDPLFGLKRLLKENPKTFVRKNSKSFIVLFEFDNYRYTPSEWKNFAEKYENTYFITFASRRGIGSNLPHSSLGLKWLRCDYTHIAQQLAKYIRGIARSSN